MEDAILCSFKTFSKISYPKSGKIIFYEAITIKKEGKKLGG